VRLGVEAALVGDAFVPGDVEIVDGTISGYGLASPNGKGRGIAAPGLVDLQVNGFGGVDLLEADANGFCRAGAALLETGVTAYLPTFITAPEEQVIAALREVPRRIAGPRILGVHLEGPFLAARRLGTHPSSCRRDPDPELLDRLLDAGPVRLMTLAPELPGASDLIDLLHARGVTVSCGHSDATAEEADAAFDRGIRSVTHLFNAMRPLQHRDPGIVGSALARDDVVVQIILDGIHLAAETAKVVWRAAAGRVALVTDAIAGAGTLGADGPSSLGGLDVTIRDGVALGPDGVLAGSLLTMIEAVRNLHALGVPLEAALAAGSAAPARVIGAVAAGRIEVGLPADLIVLDDNLEVERVLVGGEARVAV
jgi:N-acetylglucosamine-6-phosphate deacetylase